MPRATLRKTISTVDAALLAFAFALGPLFGCVDTGGSRSDAGGVPGTGGQIVETVDSGDDIVGGLDATEMAKLMGFGANIGNTFENTVVWETGWGQPRVTQDYVNGLAKNGIKTVRVPVAWDTYARDGVINAADFARVKQVVGWILDAGMYAIVNIHWDGGWIFNEGKPDAYKLTDTVKSKFASYWQQIAAGFADVGEMLILEGLNEEANFWINGNPNGTPDYAALNELNQLFVTTVRAQPGYNATRALLVVGFTTDIAKTCVADFALPRDPAGAGKLFLSIHYYDPYMFTMMEAPASWGSPSATWGTAADVQAIEASFTKLATFTASRRIPVIIGEFAVTKGQKVVRDPASRSLWMQSVAKAALARGMVPVLWDTGSDISRKDGSLSTELQAALNGL
jgi:endoglucanase